MSKLGFHKPGPPCPMGEMADGYSGRRGDFAPPPRHRYVQTIVVCVALEDQSVELLIEVSPRSPTHASFIEGLTRHLKGAQGKLRAQLP